MAYSDTPPNKKVMGEKPPIFRFFAVFVIFQGHVTFSRDSQGHIRILLFPCASFGTGPVRVRPWEGQKRLKSRQFGRYGDIVPGRRSGCWARGPADVYCTTCRRRGSVFWARCSREREKKSNVIFFAGIIRVFITNYNNNKK